MVNETTEEQPKLSIYRAHAQPPEDALKAITGGRLKGKTDINPQWRYEAVTSLFGPVGIGWKYRVVDRREFTYGEEVALFVTVEMQYRIPDGLHERSDGTPVPLWSEPITGTGGSMLVAMEQGGPHLSDEAEKMAVTDALSVCFKMIGIGSDIYRGRWDGSKYGSGDKVTHKCPKCGKPLRMSKDRPEWYCWKKPPQFDGCGATFPDQDGTPTFAVFDPEKANGPLPVKDSKPSRTEWQTFQQEVASWSTDKLDEAELVAVYQIVIRQANDDAEITGKTMTRQHVLDAIGWVRKKKQAGDQLQDYVSEEAIERAVIAAGA